MINLINGDCLQEMDKLIEQCVSVDLTVTSPPYDNLRTYKGSLQWNENIWRQVIEKLYQITSDGGVVVWVVGDATIKGSESGTSFKQALYFKEVGFNLHDTMIYQTNKPPIAGRRYQQDFEYMFVFSKGSIKTFNPIKIKTLYPNAIHSGGMRDKNGNKQKRTINGKSHETKTKGNIWYLPRSSRSGDCFSKKHPATFPEQLAKDHIISWSNENDTIFDPFMGSGTTGKMAKLNNRNFIGIEKVKEYYNLSQERIIQTKTEKASRLF